MLKPQVLETVFVAGCLLIGATGSAVDWSRVVFGDAREIAVRLVGQAFAPVSRPCPSVDFR
jgi:hypothetical protein